jgi:general secretion pathway protein L
MLALGIDPGDEAIGLALLDTGGRAPRLVGSWRERRDPGASLADAVSQAIAAHCPSPPETVACALPGRLATFRILRLPFSDASRLAATVPFELESAVPFDLATAVTAFTPLERGTGGTTIFAAIATRDAVAAHLAELVRAGVDPAVLDLGALPLAGLFERPGADLLVVEPQDDGGVALFRRGHLVGLHVLHAGGAKGPEALLAEARWAALALAGDEPVPPIAVAGPASEGARRLAADLGVPLAPPMQHLPPWAENAPVEHLRAVALAGRAAGILRLGVNLRTGDLAYHAPSEEARRQLRTTAILGGVAALLAIVFLGTAVAQRRAELGALRARIAESVRGVLANPTPGTERLQLEAAIDALAKRRDTLAGGSSGRPPTLELLRGIAESLPATTPLEVQDLTVDTEGIRIHARTDSYESVNLVTQALQRVPGTTDAQVKDVKTGVDGRVEFRASLEFEGKS